MVIHRSVWEQNLMSLSVELSLMVDWYWPIVYEVDSPRWLESNSYVNTNCLTNINAEQSNRNKGGFSLRRVSTKTLVSRVWWCDCVHCLFLCFSHGLYLYSCDEMICCWLMVHDLVKRFNVVKIDNKITLLIHPHSQ